MVVTVGSEGDVPVVSVAGELDHSTLGPLLDSIAALDEGAPYAIFDVGELCFMGSAGIHAAVRLEAQVGRVEVRGCTRIQGVIFGIVGLGHVVTASASRPRPSSAVVRRFR